MIAFHCPNCGHAQHLTDDQANTMARCPACLTVRLIPSPSNQETQQFLSAVPDTPVSEWTTQSAANSGTPHAPPTAPGRITVPGYEVLEELGRGGMGVVYKARQIKLNRLVALKMILSGGHAGEAELSRFRTEAEAIASLQHPNIVQVYEIGEHEGKPFFSLELCTGGSLERKLGGTPLSSAEAAKLVEVLARAMHAAHQANVIHRDLKPANVLLTADGTPKITDFGLAKKLDEVGQTQSGAIMGTPSYMAPEQAAGKTRELGPAADIYALGAILYELLTGRPPFKAATPLDTIMQVVADEPVSITQLQSRTPRDLETICLKCLHKLPTNRYATALGLAEDLARFQAGKPILARPVGRLERFVKWTRRNPVVSALVAAVVLLLISGTVISTLFAVDASKQRRQAELQAEAARMSARQARVNLYAAHLNLIQRAWEAGQPDLVADLLQRQVPAEGETDLRGFEWYYWDRQQKFALLDTGVLNRSVMAIAFHPGGRILALGGGFCSVENAPELSPEEDRTGKVWAIDSVTGQEVRAFQGHPTQVYHLAYSPDGKSLAAGGSVGRPEKRRGQITLWSAETGRLQCSINMADLFPGQCSFALTDREVIAAGSTIGDTEVRIARWDRTTGKLIQARSLSTKATPRFAIGLITGLSLSPDGARLALLLHPSRLSLWDVPGWKQIHELSDVRAPVAFARDSRLLALNTGGPEIKVVDGRTGSLRLRAPRGASDITALTFSPDNTQLASADESGGARVWGLLKNELISRLRGHSYPIGDLAYSPDGRRLAVAAPGPGEKGQVKVWDAMQGQSPLQGNERLAAIYPEVRNVHYLPGVIAGGRPELPASVSVAFELRSPDGRWQVSGGAEENRSFVAIQNVAARRLWWRQVVPGAEVGAWGPDGRLFVADGKSVRVLAVASKAEEGVIDIPARQLACSRDGHWLAMVTSKQMIARDLIAGTTAWTSDMNGERTGKPIFSPDGRLVACADQGGTRIWELEGGRLVHTVRPAVGSIVFDPAGKRLVGITGNEPLVWDLLSGEMVLRIPHDFMGVETPTVTPTGQIIAPRSEGRVVWDGSPLTESAKQAREALGVVRHLDWLPLLRDEAQARLARDGTLSEPVRKESLRLLLVLPDNKDRLLRVARERSEALDLLPGEYEAAWRCLEKAWALGVARHLTQDVEGRLLLLRGQPTKAAEVLLREDNFVKKVLIHGPLALARLRAGQTAGAKSALAMFRQAFQKDDRALSLREREWIDAVESAFAGK